jgi:integrase
MKNFKTVVIKAQKAQKGLEPKQNKNDSVTHLTLFPSRDSMTDISRGGWSMDGKVYQYRDKFRVYFSWEGKAYFRYTYMDGTPLYDRRQAERVLEVIRAEIDKAKREKIPFDPTRWAANKPFLFERAAQLWLDLSDICPEYRFQRKRIIEKILTPYWHGTDIRDITEIEIKEFLRDIRKRGWKDKYIKNIMNEFRMCLTSHLKKNCPQFPTVTVQEGPVRWLNWEQQEKVFEFIPSAERPIFDFLRFSGCRPNEACGLFKADIDWQNRQIVIQRVIGARAGVVKPRTKTGRIKVIPLIPELEEALKPKYLGHFVFMALRHGKIIPYSKKILERVWDIANAKAHEKDGTPIINLYNGTRHSFGCQRLNQGYARDAIKQVMGHTTERMSERYAQYSNQSLADVMRGKVVCADFVQKKIEGESN